MNVEPICVRPKQDLSTYGFNCTVEETSLSLLDRVCQETDSESWDRLVELYAPLLKRRLKRYDVQHSDAGDDGHRARSDIRRCNTWARSGVCRGLHREERR